MALVVEDGTGLSNADSYLSIADADTYHENLGNTDWDAEEDAVKEAALRKATAYLDNVYSWSGDISSTTQSLNWPRTGVYDSQGRDLSDQVPQKVKDATAELALASLSGNLMEITDNSNYVKREKLDKLETEYFSGAPVDRQYRYVDTMLSDLYDSKTGGGGSTKLLRV